jgi:superfamily II DNA or RNA helicase|tara:strand:- start:7467 stop:8975 length:1509 start_codon:yes stop_codon:yes gene_type:complete
VELSLTENKQLLRIDEATELELEQLNISLNKRIESWRFNPLVKKGLWDGYVSYIKDDKWIPSGLWREVMGICKEYKFEFKLNGITDIFDTSINQEKFTEWALEFFEKSEITPRDYQIEAAFNILKFKRCLSELATSAGKTLISFLTVAYLLEHQKAQRILFIVPNVSLVLQASEDFLDYNYRNQADIKVQQIYSGQKIRAGRNVVIGTYQSLVKKDKAYFAEFDAVIVDETHKAKSASIKTILQKCVNAEYKYGLSGTIPKEGTLDRLTLMAYTGPLITEISANYLQNEGHIAGCKVKIIKMDYAPQSTKDAFREMSQNRYESKDVFKFEQNYVINSPGRLNFITNIISRVRGNSLVLFHRIEHGKKIYEKLRQDSDKQVYYVDGGIDQDIREEHKKKMEAGEEVVIVASYGTFSTGISIKKIHNIFFTESFKSEVIIRQSIGRGLRQHSSKDSVNIIDFVDDLSSPDWDNYLMRHSKERQRIYREQKFKYDVKNVDFEGDI